MMRDTRQRDRRAYHRRWEAENRKAGRVRHPAAEAIRAFIRAAKSVPCMDCGGTFDPVCMDFDHRPGETKIANVGTLVHSSMEVVVREIAKCDVVCANCHRLRTYRLRSNFGESVSHGRLKSDRQLDLGIPVADSNNGDKS